MSYVQFIYLDIFFCKKVGSKKIQLFEIGGGDFLKGLEKMIFISISKKTYILNNLKKLLPHTRF